mgnify:CR=1 FL=1
MFPPKPPKGADPRMYFFLFLLTLGTTLGYQGWTLLYTNFAVESAHLSAADNGLVQSLREVPGLLGFLIIPLLLVMKEHRGSRAGDRPRHGADRLFPLFRARHPDDAADVLRLPLF